MQTAVASLIVFGLLILFHELGHFLVAKRIGVKVYEFSMGFGPKVFGLLRGETVYNLRAFPLGGFVRMAGMDPQDEEKERKEVEEHRLFKNKTVLQRFAVIFAGPLMNFILAALLLSIIFMVKGYPFPTTKVGKVLPEQPAALAGIRPGDVMVAIDGLPVNKWQQVSDIIGGQPGKKITLTVRRGGQQLNFKVVPKRDQKGKGVVGIVGSYELQRLSLFPALYHGSEHTLKITVMIIQFLGEMIKGNIPADVSGPVRVVVEIDRAAQIGLLYLIELTAFLSINLGLINLFPVPALDGSRLMFLGIEGLRGRPVDPVKENLVHLVGFGLLMVLIVFITYNDVLQIWGLSGG